MSIGKNPAKKIGTKILRWSILVILIVLIYQYSTSVVKKKAEDWLRTGDNGSYMENGLRVKQECTGEYIVPRKEAKTVIEPVPGTPVINTVMDCRTTEKITELEPGEIVAIRHRDFGPQREKENRCSFNFCGDSIPVGGQAGTVTRERFVNDLSFPEFPFGVVVFYILDDDGKLIDKGYLSKPGDTGNLANNSVKRGTLFSRYNGLKTYLEDKNFNVQIGWDGSTVAHEIVRTNPNPPQH